MRPTKEMIMETEALIAKTNKAMRRIVRENDLEIKSLRRKAASGKRRRFATWLLVFLLLVLLLSYPLVRRCLL